MSILPTKKTINRSPESDTVFYAFGGGKGGIGKTFLSSNFGIHLAKKGKKTLIVDLDLGGANVHTYLGIKPLGPNLKDYLNGKVTSIEDVISVTNTNNLFFIKGLDDWTSDLKIDRPKIEALIDSINKYNFDSVIFDLAAGTHSETIDFFLSCDVQIIVSTPEPTSIENSYQFLKKAFHRTVIKTSEDLQCVDEINKLLHHKERFNIKTPTELISFLIKKEPILGKLLKKNVFQVKPKILINQARSHQDQILSTSIERICSKYFSMDCESIGFVHYDSAIWQSLRVLKPFQIEQVNSNTSNELIRIFNRLAIEKSLNKISNFAI